VTSDFSTRKGQLTVRRGKGERYRQVPVGAEARTVLDTWLAARRRLPGADGPALFLSLKGQRLSTRAVDLAVRRPGREADVTLSAHTLRHTCLTGLVRAGHDIVLVAELAGHSRLETTRRYSLASPVPLVLPVRGLRHPVMEPTCGTRRTAPRGPQWTGSGESQFLGTGTRRPRHVRAPARDSPPSRRARSGATACLVPSWGRRSPCERPATTSRASDCAGRRGDDRPCGASAGR